MTLFILSPIFPTFSIGMYAYFIVYFYVNANIVVATVWAVNIVVLCFERRLRDGAQHRSAVITRAIYVDIQWQRHYMR